MNNVNLIGNLTRDPDMKYSQSGSAVMNCNIAVRRAFKNKQTGDYESDFINLKAFGKTAELFSNSLRKGSKVGLTGTIQTGSYENQQGQKVYTTDVVVNQVTFIESRRDSNQLSNQSNQNNDPFENGAPIDIQDDDLPF